MSITSFLAVFLRLVGTVYERAAARAFLQQAGKHVEIFLPLYNWFDRRGNIRPRALQQFHLLRKMYGMEDLRSVHAGYAGQGFLLTRFFMNPADPRTQRATVQRIKSELRLLGLLRTELSISHPLLYVVHPGRREKGLGWRESFQSAVATVRAVLDDALAAGVCVSVENIYSQAGTEGIGVTFEDMNLLLTQIGKEWIERGVLGWTFDPSHALLAYSGNYDAIERDLGPLLPSCIHLHLNHPWTKKDRAGEILSEWGRGDDYHASIVRIPQRTRYWTLLKRAIKGSRVPQWKTITYEVNWAAPFLAPLFGGSPLAEVRAGYDALLRFCNSETEAFDVGAIERYIESRLEETTGAGS